MSNILFVEDERSVQQFVINTLQGHNVHTVETVREAVMFIQKHPLDLVIVDLMLADDNGMDVVRHVRQLNQRVGVIILTGYGSLKSAIEAIELKAYAYLEKPILPSTLRASVATQLQRIAQEREEVLLAKHMRAALEAVQATPQFGQGARLLSGKLLLDRDRFEATYDKADLALSTSQFRILWMLVKKAGEPITAVDIVQEALGYPVEDYEATDIAKNFISQIRRKLSVHEGAEMHIKTIRGKGYMWAD